MLISMDGIDGCGKSTQVALLAEHIGADRVREPTDGRWGRLLRSLDQPTLEQQLAYFLADRASHVPVLEEAAGSEAVHRVSDRSYLSTVGYQSFESPLSPDLLERINLALVPPYDLMIVLDLPVEVGLGRVASRDGTRDWCETEDRLTWVRQVLQTWAAQRDNVVLVDASPLPEEVFAQVVAAAEAASVAQFGQVVWTPQARGVDGAPR